MYCENCGSKLPEGAKFCGDCGATVETETKEPMYAAGGGPSSSYTPPPDRGWQAGADVPPSYPSQHSETPTPSRSGWGSIC